MKRFLHLCLLTIMLVGGLLAFNRPVQAAPWDGKRHEFVSPRFEKIWKDGDLAVQQGTTSRSWTWGPEPWFDYKEVYTQSPTGLRQVQYFDKARMEINQPDVTTGTMQGVTNGLLVVEMVSGRMKTGDLDHEYFYNTSPAYIPVAGDSIVTNPDAPMYIHFLSLATVHNDNHDINKVGQNVGTTLNNQVQLGFNQALADLPGTKNVVYESVTGHNVPQVFETFRNSLTVPALETFGYPISDAYWVRTKVGGVEKDVMVQLYERRVLTYTPSNPAQFQVEMGNVGQHYFQWRYPNLGVPWATDDPTFDITFASKSSSSVFDIYQYNLQNKTSQLVISNLFDKAPYSISRGWPFYKLQIHYWSPNYPNGDKHPMISPDGKKLIFASNKDGNSELYMLPTEIRTMHEIEPTRLTDTTNCSNEHPTWLPDGSGIVYASNCLDGNYEIYKASLNYTEDQTNVVRVASLISPSQAIRLTNNTTDDRAPRISPDGKSIVFTAYRDGNQEIYVMNSDGSKQTRLTNNEFADDEASWSPDGSQLVFNSNRVSNNHELFVMNRDGSNQIQITFNAVDDGYAVWAQ